MFPRLWEQDHWPETVIPTECQIWPVMLLMCLYLQKMKDIYHTFFILECILTLVPCSVITLNVLLVLRCSDKTVDLCPGV